MTTAGQTSEGEGHRREWVAMGIGVLVVVTVAAVALVLVRRNGPAETPPSASKPTTADYSITQWVAVLGYGPDAFALYPDVQAVGKIVGVYAFTDRWSCYDGFPARTVTDADDWFLGLASQDRSQLDRLVADVGRPPLVQVQVRSTCVLAPPNGEAPTLSDGQAGGDSSTRP